MNRDSLIEQLRDWAKQIKGSKPSPLYRSIAMGMTEVADDLFYEGCDEDIQEIRRHLVRLGLANLVLNFETGRGADNFIDLRLRPGLDVSLLAELCVKTEGEA